MPNPKKKTSRARRGQRRSHDGLTVPGSSKCSSTGELKRPHHAHRGPDGALYYKGKQISAATEE